VQADNEGVAGDEFAFPPIRGVQLLPERRGPLPVTDLFADWLKDPSEVLVISGAPGVGKSRALQELHARSPEVVCIDDFPSPGTSFSEISNYRATSRGGAIKLAIATQTRIDNKGTGFLSVVGIPNIWAMTLHPLAIPEVQELVTKLSSTRNVSRLHALIAMDERGHDTHFLRSRQSLAILLRLPPSELSTQTITELVREFVVELTYRGGQGPPTPTQHRELLSMVCYEHFKGLGSSHRQGQDALASVSSTQEVSFESFEELFAKCEDIPANMSDARSFVNASPFLTLRFETRHGHSWESERIVLPDALVYEYFVASGMLLSLRKGEDLKVSPTSLGQLSDGMIVLFLQAAMEKDDFDRLERQCRRSDLSDVERLLLLFLLEDEESFVPLLREAGHGYFEWLDRFKAQAPNTFCWKMAAYQLLAVGRILLSEYLEVVESELPDERAYEFTAHTSRGGGDIDKQLIARLRRDDLRNCRGVTAIRMGISGSMDCIVPLADAMADSTDKYERSVMRRELQKIVMRHKQR
jgi:hypothetical protein